MAVTSNTIDWEVDAATGSDSNGGGFDRSASGTDKSYGASQAATTWTDLKTDATTNTKVKSNGGSPRAMDATDIGNHIQIPTGVTGWTAGFYTITAGPDGSGFMTLNASPAAVSTTGGQGTLGGALATLGKAGFAHIAKNRIFLKYNASVYSVTSATTNIAGGCLSLATGGNGTNLTSLIGYHSIRGDFDGTRPTLQASGISSFTLVNNSNANTYIANVIVDANNLTSGNGINSGTQSVIFFCKVLNCKGTAFLGGSTSIGIACEATGCSSTSFSTGGVWYGCTADSNSATPFNSSATTFYINCLAINNTGVNTFGFNIDSTNQKCVNCTAYNNGGASGGGFNLSGGGLAINCLAVGHTTSGALGFAESNANDTGSILITCAAYNNNTNYSTNFNTINKIGCVTLTADPFVNAAGGNFGLNSTSGCAGIGIPITAPGLSSTNMNLDVGASQSGPSTTVYIPIPSMSTQEIIQEIMG